MMKQILTKQIIDNDVGNDACVDDADDNWKPKRGGGGADTPIISLSLDGQAIVSSQAPQLDSPRSR